MKKASQSKTLRKIQLTFFFTFILLNVYAQETKLVTKKNGDITTKFYVLKNDKSIKHGSYTKYIESVTQTGFLEIGNYNQGLRDGEWIYFYLPYLFNSANNIKQKINYFNGKKNGLYMEYYRDSLSVQLDVTKSRDEKATIIEQKNLQLRIAGMYINDNRFGRWKSFDPDGNLIQDYDFSKKILYFDKTIKDSSYYNLSRNAIFLGGESKMQENIIDSFLFMKVVSTIDLDSTTVKISFKINKEGNVSDCKVEKNTGNIEFEKEAIKAINTTSGNWIFAVSDGIPVDTLYNIFYDVRREKNESGIRRFGFTCYSSY